MANAAKCYAELTLALESLDKMRATLEPLRDWARGEMARENTRAARETLERVVPENLREVPPAEPLGPAGRCFREVTKILNKGV